MQICMLTFSISSNCSLLLSLQSLLSRMAQIKWQIPYVVSHNDEWISRLYLCPTLETNKANDVPLVQADTVLFTYFGLI